MLKLLKSFTYLIAAGALLNSAIAESTTPQPAPSQDPPSVTPPLGKVPQSLIKIGQGQYFSAYAFLMDKSTRTLSVWKHENGLPTLVSSHPSDMGRKEGDKMKLGDLKTPEGIYFFQKTFQNPNLNYQEYGKRAFTLDYPNFYDQRERKTGSGIWLHAIPETKTLTRGSRGCIVVRNEVIEKFGDYIQLKRTPIIVTQKAHYISPEQALSRKQKFVSLLEKWRASWVSKNIENYINFYHDQFKSLRMNKSIWKSYKEELNKKYAFIKVETKNPVILQHNDKIVVRFLQSYESDKKSDLGEKHLYLKLAQQDSTEAPDEYKIIGEQWVATEPGLIATKKQ